MWIVAFIREALVPQVACVFLWACACAANLVHRLHRDDTQALSVSPSSKFSLGPVDARAPTKRFILTQRCQKRFRKRSRGRSAKPYTW